MRKIEQINSQERSLRLAARQTRIRKLRSCYQHLKRAAQKFRSGLRPAAQVYITMGNLARANHRMRPDFVERIFDRDRRRLPRVLRFGKAV